jgi:hypothetical protein
MAKKTDKEEAAEREEAERKEAERKEAARKGKHEEGPGKSEDAPGHNKPAPKGEATADEAANPSQLQPYPHGNPPDPEDEFEKIHGFRREAPKEA